MKKVTRRTIIILLLSVIAFSSNAQSTRYFEHILGSQNDINGENMNAVLQLPSGSYIIVGEQYKGDFIRTDAYGNSVLDTLYQDTLYNSLFEGVRLLNDGNLIAAGWHDLINYTNQTDTTEQMWLVKMDTTGHIIWSTVVGDSILPSDAWSIEKSYDGGYILGGETDINEPKAIIVKTDSQGNKLWEKRLAVGIGENWIQGVSATPDSDFVCTGASGDNISIAHKLARFSKVDNYGNVLKDTVYCFSPDYQDFGIDIAYTPDGGYVIGGTTDSSPLLFKINNNFDTVWHRLILSSQNILVGGTFNKIYVLSDSSIIACGDLGYYISLMKFSPDGQEIWRRLYRFSAYPYADYAYGMDTTTDGGFILCGRSENADGSDVPFIKTNCLGFVAPPTASFTDTLDSMSVIKFWNTSENTDTCYWNWGDGSPIQMVRADSTVPVYHSYLNNQGAHNVTLTAIACGEIDSISIVTPFVTGITSSPSPLEKDAFIYPNPNDGSFTLHYSLPSSKGEFFIKDVTGRLLYSTPLSGTEGTQAIDVSTLAKGIYYWEFVSDSGVSAMGKLAVVK